MQKPLNSITRLPEDFVLIFKAGCSKDGDEHWADYNDLNPDEIIFWVPDCAFIGLYAKLNAGEYLRWRNKTGDTS